MLAVLTFIGYKRKGKQRIYMDRGGKPHPPPIRDKVNNLFFRVIEFLWMEVWMELITPGVGEDAGAVEDGVDGVEDGEDGVGVNRERV